MSYINYTVLFVMVICVCNAIDPPKRRYRTTTAPPSNPYTFDPNALPNYCLGNLCPYQGGSTAHIGCGSTRDFASSCASDRAIVPLNQSNIDSILDLHNQLRSNLALGGLTGLNNITFKSAIRMATLKWDNELADLALLNAYQCKMEHDRCHNTFKFKISGQNLAAYSNNLYYADPQMVIDSLTYGWFNESKYTNQTNIEMCCYSFDNKDIGHFLAFVTDRSTHIGCALTKFMKEGDWRTYLYSCNYASGNIEMLPVYRPGPTASACTLGPNPNYPGLCHQDEPIDPNQLGAVHKVRHAKGRGGVSVICDDL